MSAAQLLSEPYAVPTARLIAHSCFVSISLPRFCCREAALRTCRNQLDTVRAERVAEAAAAEERYTAAQRQLEMAREELGAARAAEAELGTLAATLAKTGARAARALRTAGEVIEKHGAGAESEGSEEWREQGGETAAAAELVHLSMDEVRHLMGKGRKPSPGGGVLEGVLAEVDRCRQSGGGEKAKARRGGGRELTASLHKALAVLEQEVRWGEVMAAGA